MDELVRWLGEQLDEDERIARAAGNDRVAPTPWRGESWDDAVLDGDGLVDANGDGIALVKGERVRAHILQHDPARMLREIDAKRRLIDEHDIGNRRVEDCFTMECQSNRFPCTTLRLLALPYADRPGDREDWRP
jgi:hypothetical protein